MKHLPSLTSWFLTGSLLASLSCLSPAAQAQTPTVTYDLTDVWLLPTITHPRGSAKQLTGTFVWTYTAGKFVSLNLPWWGTRTTPA